MTEKNNLNVVETTYVVERSHYAWHCPGCHKERSSDYHPEDVDGARCMVCAQIEYDPLVGGQITNFENAEDIYFPDAVAEIRFMDLDGNGVVYFVGVCA